MYFVLEVSCLPHRLSTSCCALLAAWFWRFLLCSEPMWCAPLSFLRHCEFICSGVVTPRKHDTLVLCSLSCKSYQALISSVLKRRVQAWQCRDLLLSRRLPYSRAKHFFALEPLDCVLLVWPPSFAFDYVRYLSISCPTTLRVQ